MWTSSTLAVVMVILVVVQMTGQSAGQSLHYSEAQLKTYARLSQQLRAQLYRGTLAVHLRLLNIQQRMQNLMALDASVEAKADLLSRISSVDSIARSAKIANAMAVVVTPPVGLNNPNVPILTNVVLDFGMGFDGPASSVVIPRSGVYMIEYKTQVNAQNSYYHQLEIYNVNGAPQTTLTFYTDWEVTPHYRMLELLAGQRITGSSFSDSNSYGLINRIMTAGPYPRSWFTFRYLGQ